MPRVVTVDAAACVVIATTTIENDGVASASCIIQVLNTDGNPMAGLAAANIVLAVSGSGNTVTQPTGVTNANGFITGSFVSTVAATKTVSFTVLGTAITDTASTVVSGSAVTYPNEPAGMTAFAEHNLSAIPSGANGILGSWANNNSNALLTIASEASAPQSPNNVINIEYPDGWTSGLSPGRFTYENATEYQRIYTSMQMRIVEATYENESVFTKINFWGGGSDPVGAYNDLFMVMLSPSAGRTHSAFTIGARQQNVVSRNLNANVDTSAVFTCEDWHQVEVELVLNSAVDVADGEWRWWVDGTLCGEYTDVVFRTTAEPRGLRGFKFDPTYGGNTGDTKTGDANWQVDHVYLSGELL